MTDIDGRPQPYIGVGGVVGAGKERALTSIADELNVSESGRKLVLSVNATHGAQMMENVKPHEQFDVNWNPQTASQLTEALSGEHDTNDVMTMATVRLDNEYATNPGYTDRFASRTLERASWADVIRFSGFGASDFDSHYMEQLLANTHEKAPEKAVAVDYPLPTLEQLQAQGALQTVADQLVHYATVLDYIVLTTRAHTIQSARAVIERIYEEPELDGVGIAIEAKSPDTATNTRISKLLSDFPDLSIHAEESLHVTPDDASREIDIVAARHFVKKALEAIEAGANVTTK